MRQQMLKKTMKSNKVGVSALFSGMLLLASSYSVAQSNYKEGSNSFARYMQSGDLKNLEEAKKFIDASYQVRRDSNSVRVNVLRAMIYSSMAYADSTRKIKNPSDPIDIAYHSLNKVKKHQWGNYPAERSYIQQNLAASQLYQAKKSLENEDYTGAYRSYLKVRDLQIKQYDVTYNLALLAVQTEQFDEAKSYYKELIMRGDAPADYYLQLAEVYDKTGEQQAMLNTLQDARIKFPENQEVLLNLIQLFARNKEYKAIAPIIDQAVEHDPENVDLTYLAGYANETVGQIDLAKRYYNRVLELDQNNYEANLALGLIYLDVFLNDKEEIESQYIAQNLLLKANEIRPYDVNALQSLSLYYEQSGDFAQLDRVKLLLNQLSNN